MSKTIRRYSKDDLYEKPKNRKKGMQKGRKRKTKILWDGSKSSLYEDEFYE